jgi:methylated-DNA-protein-cysteine methyltransferase-like protein
MVKILKLDQKGRQASLFRRHVYKIVGLIPRGRVATYGEIALLVGLPRAAYEVGWIAHNGPANIPWQRVVNRFGGLAKGYPGGQRGHQVDLEKDGIIVRDDMTVDLTRYQWRPDRELARRLELPPEVIEEVNRKIPFSLDKLSVRGRKTQIATPNDAEIPRPSAKIQR